MSRIGNQPVNIPENTELNLEKDMVKIKGPRGELEVPLYHGLEVEKENSKLHLERKSSSRRVRAMHGTTRNLIYNSVIGVTEGFDKKLQMKGVGYRAKVDNKTLVLTVGYSHPVRIEPPEGIQFKVNDNTEIVVSGIDKQQVGQAAAQVRSVRPPDPYKGKGIRYKGEHIRKKPGKAAKAMGLGE